MGFASRNRQRGRSVFLVVSMCAMAMLVLGSTPATALFGDHTRARSEHGVETKLVGYFVVRDGKLALSWNPQEASQETMTLEFACPPVDAAHPGACQHQLHIESDPVPINAFLNVTHDIAAALATRFYPGGQATALSGDLRLTAGGSFVGGAYESLESYYCWPARCPDETADRKFDITNWRISPEVRVLRAGTAVIVDATLYSTSQQTTPDVGNGPCFNIYVHVCGGLPRKLELKTGGPDRSFLQFALFSEDEVFFRHPELFPGQRVEGEIPTQALGTESAGMGLAVLPSILLLGARRHGRRPAALLFLSCGALLAGCLDAGGSDASDDAGSPQNGNVKVAFVPEDGVSSNASRTSGSVVGTVVDPLGRGVPSAHVSLLEANRFATTTIGGRFEIADVVAGTYTLRIERQGFHVYATPVTVVVGNTTLLAIELASDKQTPLMEHYHDYWGTAKQIVMMDGEIENTCYPSSWAIPGAFGQCTEGGKWFNVPVLRPGTKVPNLVPPGTSEVEITLTWPETGAPRELGIVFNANDDGLQRWLDPRGPGTKFHLQTTWEMTEPGHSLFSAWQWGVFIRDSDPYRSEPQTQLSIDWKIQVDIRLHRSGTFPIEEGHPNFWGNATAYPVMSATRTMYYWGNTFNQSDGGCAWCTYRLVPPGTKWVEFVARPETPVPTGAPTWHLHVKPASLPDAVCAAADRPTDCDLALPDPTANGNVRTWNLPITDEQADPYYAKASNWRVWFSGADDVSAEGLTYGTGTQYAPSIYGNRVSLNLTITAHADSVPE